MNILIANDHAGFNLKQQLLPFLQTFGNVTDLGADNDGASDYPLYAKLLCEKMTATSKGILICGSGIGMCIAANRFKYIFSAVCHTIEETILARHHNNINVLCLAARFPHPHVDIVKTFLTTEFLNEERHIKRLGML